MHISSHTCAFVIDTPAYHVGSSSLLYRSVSFIIVLDKCEKSRTMTLIAVTPETVK